MFRSPINPAPSRQDVVKTAAIHVILSSLGLILFGLKVNGGEPTLNPVNSVEAGTPDNAQRPTINFDREVRPILSEACFSCHGPDEATRAADLRLDEADSAKRVLEPGSDGRVVLLERILSEDEYERMPPPEANQELTEDELKTLRLWIEAGAEYEPHWAFRQPQRPALLPEHLDPWCSNPIDGFVLAELRRNQLQPSPPAPATKLARRLSLDLTGLPIPISELDHFLQQAEHRGVEQAADRLMDRLMHSPRYAEQMALPWLEAARYADTDGYQNDRYRYQHAWRDYVLKAFNEKLSYDQFVVEQLAGDLLPGASLWQQVATGFGRNHRINSEDGSIPDEWLTENVVDRVDTFGTVFLGLTVGCARCHDHKYDPISQREYYELFAYFNSIAEHGVGPNNGNSPPFIELPESWPLLSPEQDHAIEPEPVQLRNARQDAGNGLKRPQAGSPQTVMVMHELEQPRATYLLQRGQYNMPDKSERLHPGIPGILDQANSEPLISETGTSRRANQTAGSQDDVRAGRSEPVDRLELARWLVDGRNPLTARVIVNRLWQQIFGTGLVATSENFGAQGALPSHPELLDWLACELVDSGWSLQHIQRLILGSSTYRQSTEADAERRELDPQNRLLSRGPELRMSGFQLRDQALAVSGLLVHRTGGPSVKPYMPENIWSSISNNKYEQDSGESLFRRSLYTYWRRTIPPPTMMNFNAAAREVCVVRTEQTNTPLQALTLLNNKTFVEASRCMAERVMASSRDLNKRLNAAFRLVTARNPTVEEFQLLRDAYQLFLTEFRADPVATRELLEIGEAPRSSDWDCVQHAAWTMTSSLILNLDEAVMKD